MSKIEPSLTVSVSLDWDLPGSVHACITTRQHPTGNGCNESEEGNGFGDFNLATHVGDDLNKVQENRALLYSIIGLPVTWFSQVHGVEVARLSRQRPIAFDGCEADAVFSRDTGLVCAVQTADCLPVLLASRHGDEVAAVHCGWRGLASGILANTLREFKCKPEDVLAYLGPAISQPNFQVGGDVVSAFQKAQSIRCFSKGVAQFFMDDPAHTGRYHADLYGLARSELNGLGVVSVSGGDCCTYADEQFYSYRRDRVTGRMASLIWLSA